MSKVGIIPFRFEAGAARVLMVTSQTRSRWVFPKGNVDPGESNAHAGEREGFEEAGIRGAVLEHFPLPALVDRSAGRRTKEIPVVYYPFLVHEEAAEWPESTSRLRRWFTLDEAEDVARHEDMLNLLKRFAALAPDLKTAPASAAAE